ncbi:hypothetical protein BJ742DRAFT_765758 [Cladochytrium replicatum]|nr:hypothetical protein BJ742DRAFT_765758 [Cladochytrium replicatum]
MSGWRSLFLVGEKAVRRGQVQERIFWQAPSDRPVYIRGRGDSVWLGVTLALTAVVLYKSVVRQSELIKGNLGLIKFLSPEISDTS